MGDIVGMRVGVLESVGGVRDVLRNIKKNIYKHTTQHTLPHNRIRQNTH
jgi:hypothetical protein